MKLLSVSVSMGKEVPYMGKTVTTGIFKEPVSGRIMLRTLNLDGDRQIDLRGHGGPFKAVASTHLKTTNTGSENSVEATSSFLSSERISPSRACTKTKSMWVTCFA